MKLNTFRNQELERDPEAMTYWKRRFVALAAGLTVAAAMAWAFSGVLGASGVSDAAAGHLAAAHDGRAGTSGPGRAGLGGGTGPAGSGTGPAGNSSGPDTTGRKGKRGPAAETGSAGSGSGARAPDRAASGATQQPGSAASGAGQGQATAEGLAQAAGLAAAPSAMRRCKPGDVVLSLFASRDRYRRGQVPQFDVDVVSTANRSCAFNVGREFLSLAVRAHGQRIWDSSDCVSGRRSQVIKLVRGVPAILPVTWDLDRSSARGCAKTSHPALTGRFAASAAGDGLASNTVKFLVR
jgi:hypothetical protein